METKRLLIYMTAVIIAFTVGSCNNTATDDHDDHMDGDHEEMMDDHVDAEMPQGEMDHEHMDHADHGQNKSTNSGAVKSPRKSAMANIGKTHVHVDYAAPSMRGRQIFGGLVGYGQVWTPGAHKATTIQFDQDVMVEGQPISKGKYGLFTIPGEDEWTVMINKNNDMHLADDYAESDDVVRFKVVPEKLQEPVEQLTIEVLGQDEKSGLVILKWADVMLDFSVKEN